MLPRDDVTLCEAMCCADQTCVAWVYASSAPADFESCTAGSHCCYMKGSVTDEKPLAGLTNGLMGHAPIDASAPPIGMRSAVPLGGMGAGALELRADGSVHEVTIINQSPAGAAKYGVLGDMVLGVRAGATARPVRTNPPAYAAPGVAQIAYSGSYPLSRLAINDPSLPVTSSVYAYSTFVPGNMEASAYPAVTFTLTASNPSATAQPVSFFLGLPFAAVNDCARTATVVVGNATTAGYAACLTACAAQAGCSAWTWRAADGLCKMTSDVGWSVHADGDYCGVAGAWSSNGFALNLVQHPAGGVGGPANGDIALRPVLDSGSGPDGVTVGFGVANDPASLWASFAATGTFSTGNGVLASGTFEETVAAHGAASVTATLAPGANLTLSLVFAWYFPDRDHMGVSIGNYYSTLWDNAAAVAQALADQQTLERVAGAINAHHSVFLGTPSAPTSMPDWVADHMVNMFSHFRGLIWFKDGRLREFEANDCE
jgi:non-lysosomal glucosylceramidase